MDVLMVCLCTGEHTYTLVQYQGSIVQYGGSIVRQYRGSPYVWCHGQSGRNDASHTRRGTRPERIFNFFSAKKEKEYDAIAQKSERELSNI